MKPVLQKIWKGAVKTFKYLNGKKTAIGYIGMTALQLGVVKNNLSPDALEVMQWGFGIMGGVGVGHKIQKAKIQKQISTNLKNNVK